MSTPGSAVDTDASALAARVRAGAVSAEAHVRAVLAEIRRRDPAINAFTAVTEERAIAQARRVDQSIAARRDPGPLAGVPFAVKNMFDVQGIVTLAGSKINRERDPAQCDATLIARLEGAGAVLVGALNMDEYAYGFSTENSHYGATRNPHDPERVSGGSSGGSAAAVAAAMIPLALGSDTNGSIRVPASFCGIWGLKPTYGRLSRAGTFPFVGSLDHVGPFARSVRDLATAYDAMQGGDARDPICLQEPATPIRSAVDLGIGGLRIARAAGYFEEHAEAAVVEQVQAAARALGTACTVEFPEASRGRAAAFVITACEGAQLHLPNLRARPLDFDPLILDRLLAGAMVPAAWYLQAQRVRRWFYRQAMRLFDEVDVILAPSTPRPAQRIGQDTFSIRGVEMPARPNAGLLTQPISCIGLPVVAAPVGAVDGMPVGMQIIAAPWREDLCLRVARALEIAGYGVFKKESRMTMLQINLPDVVEEVTAQFRRYEAAITSNDIPVLDELFYDSPHTIRYGIGEQLYGYQEIAGFRAARPPIDLQRELLRVVITTYGRDFAMASCEYRRYASKRLGRQMQTWLRTDDGWRVIAAHVSLLPA